MLNREQILIKASQYFGFDLKKLGIEQTEEKRREDSLNVKLQIKLSNTKKRKLAKK